MHQSDANAPAYSPRQRQLHALVLVIVAFQYLLQGPMQDALELIDAGRDLTFTGFLVTTVHSLGGALVAAVMLWRWYLARQNLVPVAAGRLGNLGSRFIQFHHYLLYLSVLVMAISGALHYYLEWQTAARWHEVGKWILAALIGLHVMGALWHLMFGPREVFSRMMGRDGSR